MPSQHSVSTFISIGPGPAAFATATCESPRCSRTRSQAHHRRWKGSPGRPRPRSPLNSGRPVPSAPSAAPASRPATSAGSSPASTSARLAAVALSRAASNWSRVVAARAASYKLATRPGSNQANAAATTGGDGSPRLAARPPT
jgi:hypothetical protein